MVEMLAPLVPADADLRSYDWFPFFHKRLRQSAFWKRASDLACRISVDLWSEAYEQVPAGSVPNDDHILAEWAGFGRRDLSGWLAVKDEVMSAWTLCSDGRWYHPTLCEVACTAWVEKRIHVWKRECDRIRKDNCRRDKNGLAPLEIPSKPSDDPWIAVGNATSSEDIAPQSEGLPTPDGDTSNGRPTDNPDFPAENALKGTGTRKEEIESSSLRSEDARAPDLLDRPDDPPAKARKPPGPSSAGAAFEAWYDGYPHKVGRGAAEKAFNRAHRVDGVPLQELVDGRDRYVKSKPSDHPWCNPATWLNQKRWLDRPAGIASGGSSPATQQDPRVDLGGGITAQHSTIRKFWADGRWPGDWGPRPGSAACRVSPDLLSTIMKEKAA